MSTLNITDLLRELQAGEEARARIPQLEAFNTQLTADINKANSRNQALELNILGYKSTISDLTTKVARLEVERDDAGFRELEAQDRVNTLLHAVRGAVEDLAKADYKIDPPAPAPEPMPQPIVQDAKVPEMTEADWKGVNVSITDHGAERAVDPVTTAQDALTKAAVDYKTATDALGQSEANPTSAPTTDTQQSAAVTSSGAEPIANASVDHSSANPQAYRPFGGDAVGEAPKPTTDYPDDKRWYNRPTGMSIANWVASGGQP